MADNDPTKGTEQTEARQTTRGGSGAGAQGGATGAVETDGEAPSALGGGTATRTTVPEGERPSSKGK